MNFQRPNQITIEKRSSGALSPTGEASSAPVTVNANVPARLQPKRASEIPMVIDGVDYVQDAYLILDGLTPAQFSGMSSGQTTTANGIVYTVAPNLLSAWPEISKNYRVTDEYGTKYLVLAVAYFDQTHTVQAKLASGRVW